MQDLIGQFRIQIQEGNIELGTATEILSLVQSLREENLSLKKKCAEPTSDTIRGPLYPGHHYDG